MRVKHITEEAADAFNRVMRAHSVNLIASHLDFTPTDEVMYLRGQWRDADLSADLFDALFPSLEPDFYYNYLTIESFEALATHKSLRFFSTSKASSEGEFKPLCKELGLDGYWRLDEDGNETGIHGELMDDLFYKSFVSCPKTKDGKLWHTFANKGTGVRIKVHIKVAQEYQNFRRIAYQGSKAFMVLSSLRKSFSALGYKLTNTGLSRMPAYYQLKDFAYQNECRLIAQRFRNSSESALFGVSEGYVFPFEVGRDEYQECNYIDCSLEPNNEHPMFTLNLCGVEKGPNCDYHEWNRISGILASWWTNPQTTQ